MLRQSFSLPFPVCPGSDIGPPTGVTLDARVECAVETKVSIPASH